MSPGDGSVYVGDDDLVGPVPKVNRTMAATGSLVLSGDTENHIVWTLLQLQAGLSVFNTNGIQTGNPTNVLFHTR